jgi:glycosyltransferase involved in cell wall biosynthesis
MIQIPCYNEAETLPQTIADLPREIPGIDTIEYLVIDDGSTDGTAEIAAKLGVHHILRNLTNVGLARSFARGLDYALGAGADIIVNTDGDNQYCGEDIRLLVRPIIDGRAEVVIGDRQTSNVDDFSLNKKLLQKFGSSVVRYFSGVNVPDAVSGFRAISRSAAMQINIVSSFSYTIEMLIQVGKKSISFESVPIRTNPKTRDSRLFKSIFRFIERSGTTTLRMYAMYRPLKAFSFIGMIIAFIGLIPLIRFLYFYIFASGEGKIQSLVIGSALLVVGSLTFLLGLMADLVGRNRQLIELTLLRVRELEFKIQEPSSKGLVTKQAPITKEFQDCGDEEDRSNSQDIVQG